MEQGNCVYILKTSKRLYKIGKTQDLQKRIAGYHTHLPILFKIIRQYMSDNMDTLEEVLHVIFQHKRVKGEWFELTNDDLIICDNIARGYAIDNLGKQKRNYRKVEFSGNPVLLVMEANTKYLNDYAQIVEDVKMGLSSEEIIEHYNGAISKTTIQTIRKILEFQTPNAEFIGQWIDVVNDLEAGLTIEEILQKKGNQVNRNTVQTIRRILINQLY